MEILVVIGVFMVIMSISFYYLSGFNKKEALEKDVAGLTALIRNARLLSVASKDAQLFGIHLDTDKAVLFEGSTYTPGGEDERVIVFSKQVYMSGYALNLGTPDIVFSRLVGNTQNYGDITLSLKDDSASSTISVLQTGVIK